VSSFISRCLPLAPPYGGLLGFTSSTVGSVIYTYGEDGMTIYAKAA
jgi:hypothetical protein